jgi:hypothetical protein
MITAALVAITVYAGQYVGQPLYCGGFYDAVTVPWVAMPVSQHGVTWECGDVIGIWDGGEIRTFVALDAGPFGRHCVEQPDGGCLPIAVDVPAPHAWFDGLSTTGRVWNVTELQREWTRRAGE